MASSSGANTTHRRSRVDHEQDGLAQALRPRFRASTQSPSASWIILGVVGVAGLLAPTLLFGGSDYGYNFMISLVIWAGLAVTWGAFSGQTGYLSLGHAAFFGAGAYTVAILHPLVGPWAALTASGLIAGTVGLLLGAVTLRLRGLFFTMATIGIAEVLRLTVMLLPDFTGGGTGLTLGGLPAYSTLYYVGLPLLLIVIAGTILLSASATGRRLVAIQDDEEALGAVGIAVNRHKVLSFAATVAVAGAFGGLYALQVGYVSPDSVFPLLVSLTVVIMCFLGGVGSIWGPVAGTVVLTLVRETVWLRFPTVWDIALGAVLILIVVALPAGILGMIKRIPGVRRYLL